jgi:lysophospholipid acyltransferase (LPLAT)-like uncharacterized protein
MRSNYYINNDKVETQLGSVADQLARIEKLMAFSVSTTHWRSEILGRNLLTRTIDAVFAFVRRQVPPLHRAGIFLSAMFLFVYARLVALTVRLRTYGELCWPDIPTPSVIGLWHCDAPSLLVAFAKRRPAARTVIMVAGDPRGDCLALLCRMVGLQVVRTTGDHGGWKALVELAGELARDACVIITADGGGPARVAKVGAVALASAANVPIIPLAADCHPALQESHKWDAARNPLPFSTVLVWLGAPRAIGPLLDCDSIERARSWLQDELSQRHNPERGPQQNRSLPLAL